MNTISNDIQKVLDSKMSKRQKDEALLKMGFTQHDVNTIWFTHRMSRLYPTYKVGDLTFGVEIECYHANRYNLQRAMADRGLESQLTGYHHHESRTAYRLATDGSIRGNEPCEAVSPILKGRDGERSLKTACDALASVGAKVNKSCGLHVHFGAAEMSDEHYIRIFKNYQRLEALIDTFMPESRRNNGYCRTLAGVDFSRCTTKAHVRSALRLNRYHKVNAEAFVSHNTIEFRQHNGTTNYHKIIMWVEFLRRLIEYSHKHEITTTITSVDELPFGDARLKSYLNGRIGRLAVGNE